MGDDVTAALGDDFTASTAQFYRIRQRHNRRFRVPRQQKVRRVRVVRENIRFGFSVTEKMPGVGVDQGNSAAKLDRSHRRCVEWADLLEAVALAMSSSLILWTGPQLKWGLAALATIAG